jgi:hypothetical protein
MSLGDSTIVECPGDFHLQKVFAVNTLQHPDYLVKGVAMPQIS